jgi:hypothetical protein
VSASRVPAVIAAVLLASTGVARADDDPEVLHAAEDYFTGETQQGYAWAAVGAVSITLGSLALASDSDVARGTGYPMLAVGAIQLGAGVVSWISPPRRLRRARAAVAVDPEAYRVAERKRMGRVVVGFRALRVAEVAMMVIGAGLAIGGARTDRDLLVGIGGGIAFQGLAMLALDAPAEERAARYVERLSVSIAPGGVAVGWNSRW